MRLAKKEDFGKIIKIMIPATTARRKGNILRWTCAIFDVGNHLCVVSVRDRGDK